ncbi:MAG: hypothetical protein CFE21_07690 [Bacteroidetes bacterium B1(2017)]|nr:MAG: hypothetical protein CFE21_07690 [Bacteroidetes bacterium B1(2017)]
MNACKNNFLIKQLEKNRNVFVGSKPLITLLLVIQLLLSSCALMSSSPNAEMLSNPSAGLNGSFEIIQGGTLAKTAALSPKFLFGLTYDYTSSNLPVNWYFFTQTALNAKKDKRVESDFDILIDSTDAIEGSKSVKFVVRACDSLQWKSPGLFQEFEVASPGMYEVSFWVKNKGCNFEATISAITLKGGPPSEAKFIRSKDTLVNWTKYTVQRDMPIGLDRIRLDLILKSPGTFQLDDFRIVRLDQPKASKVL